MKKKIAILGSTGSIGTQALDVVARHADRFEAYVLTAGSNAELLIEQARRFRPDTVVIAEESKYEQVREALADTDVKVFAGAQALCEVVAYPSIDIVLTALVGFAGLRSTVAAIEAGKTIALANKETLVVAGESIMELARRHRAPIIPVDSEHSAIFQCLVGEFNNPIEKILLTASGGPFRKFTKEQLAKVTCADALKHPNWQMGAKITIDSATLMNKGLEMIEAKWLFGVQPDQIDIVVHPESIIHSAVQFADGGIKAQLGAPDMRLPIQYAFSFPERLPLDTQRISLTQLGALHFETARFDDFPCLGLAFEAVRKGGNMPCIMNAANEVANAAFRRGATGFNDIARIISMTMERAHFISSPSLDDYFSTDYHTRA